MLYTWRRQNKKLEKFNFGKLALSNKVGVSFSDINNINVAKMPVNLRQLTSNFHRRQVKTVKIVYMPVNYWLL